jgi:hypothetical protein
VEGASVETLGVKGRCLVALIVAGQWLRHVVPEQAARNGRYEVVRFSFSVAFVSFYLSFLHEFLLPSFCRLMLVNRYWGLSLVSGRSFCVGFFLGGIVPRIEEDQVRS